MYHDNSINVTSSSTQSPAYVMYKDNLKEADIG
jgi:hypothetical protein